MCFSDRLSCQRFWPNYFRLFLSVIVYELFTIIKSLTLKTANEQAHQWQVDNLRLFLLKVGATVIRRVRSVRIRFSSAFSQQKLFRELMHLC
ncbi:MAG TPA: hypothetical protein ENJ82_09885 [Bacteroidetes bacterium]|nr:hypothetical protein [Bacteroidota bacterium]